MSPTQRSYIISFVSGALLAGMIPVLELMANGQSINTWQTYAAAFAGGAVLFLRDWAKNNSNARLEKPDRKALE